MGGFFNTIGSSYLEGLNVKRKTFLLIPILLGSLAFQLYEVDEPWVGHMDFAGAIYGILSRNFIKHGYVETRFGPAINTGTVGEGEYTYYLHHPPLFYYLVSISYKLFGIHEWNARIVPILFSIVALAFFFGLVRKIWGIEEAYFSTFLLAFLPMNLYFSRIYLQESSITLGIILILWYYVKWRETRRNADYWKMVILFVIFGMIDWPAYYILPLLTIHSLIIDRNTGSPGRLRMFLLPLFGVVLFIVFLVYSSYISSHQSGAGLFHSFLFRSAMKTPFLRYSQIDFLRLEVARSYHLFTPIVLILSTIWVIDFLRVRSDLERNLYVVILLLFGSFHVLLFQSASYIHDFWLYHLCTGLSLASGLALTSLLKHRVIAEKGLVRTSALVILSVVTVLFSAREVIGLHRISENEDLSVAGMMIREMSGEDDRVIVHWEDPVHRMVGDYFRYYGSPVYTKPIPNVAYYADRNIRWGVKDIQDFESLVQLPGGRYRFFLTRIDYMRGGMDEAIKDYLLQHFEPLFMLDSRGEKVAENILSSFLKGGEVDGREGVIVFGRKAERTSGQF